MKPVAEVKHSGCYTYYHQELHEGTLLYTTDQLKAAKVEVLREAAERVACDYAEDEPIRFMLLRMAYKLENPLPAALHETLKRDEVNAAGGTLNNPDEADDTPRTPR